MKRTPFRRKTKYQKIKMNVKNRIWCYFINTTVLGESETLIHAARLGTNSYLSRINNLKIMQLSGNKLYSHTRYSEVAAIN